jgi:hypothetical protein
MGKRKQVISITLIRLQPLSSSLISPMRLQQKIFGNFSNNMEGLVKFTFQRNWTSEEGVLVLSSLRKWRMWRLSVTN